MEKYVEMDTFVSNNCIDIKKIDTFEALTKENNVNIIFYGKRTARSKYDPIEGECFLFIIDSVFYVFTYHSKYGLYKTIQDFKNAKERNILNAETYYSLHEHCKEQNDLNDYLLKEYSLNEFIVMQYEENHSYKEQKYYNEYIKLINGIENIRKIHNFNGNQSIIAFIILNYVMKNDNERTYDERYKKSPENSINPKNLIEVCSRGIIVIDYDLKIQLSKEYKSEYYRYIEEHDDCGIGRKGHWEYDEDNFIAKIKEILFKLDVDLVVDKDVKYNIDGY